ncbi:DUF6233 domain-containing protein [Streptomyces sp. NPDC054838]
MRSERGRKAEAAAARRRPPAAWLVEREIGAGRPPGRVHVGTCWDTGNTAGWLAANNAAAVARGITLA